MTRNMHQGLKTAYVGMRTPWGTADHVSPILDGIANVSTPSHGGIKLRADRNRLVPDYMRHDAGWYEEDCDWCIPFLVFEAEILAAGNAHAVRAIHDGHHVSTLKNWHPEAYERWFGVVLQMGESLKKDEILHAASIMAGGLTIRLTIDNRNGIAYGFEDRALWHGATRLTNKCWFNDADLAMFRSFGNRLLMPGEPEVAPCIETTLDPIKGTFECTWSFVPGEVA